MPGEPTVIYSAANTQQAYLLKSVLEERGIAAWVVNDAIQIAGGELPLGWTAAAKIIVGRHDADEARRIAEQFDQTTTHEPTNDDDVAGAAEGADWAEWPLCPACGERRSARCSICGSSANRFPLADIEQAEGGDRVLLVCQSCDDHFLPEWYRLCPRCGHDFGDGIEVDQPPSPREFSLRTALVVAGLLSGVVAFLAYFLWLFAGRAS
jgi:hypothetical protein